VGATDLTNDSVPHASPIVKALAFVAKKSSGEVQVRVVKKPLERDVLGAALRVFDEYRLTRTPDRNAVLIYLNRSTRRFAVMSDEGIHRAVGQRYWDELAVNFREDLLSTYFENAVSLTVYTLAVSLAKHFPRDGI